MPIKSDDIEVDESFRERTPRIVLYDQGNNRALTEMLDLHGIAYDYIVGRGIDRNNAIAIPVHYQDQGDMTERNYIVDALVKSGFVAEQDREYLQMKIGAKASEISAAKNKGARLLS